MESADSGPSGSGNSGKSRADRLNKLRELTQRKHTAKKQNLLEVEEEERKRKLPSNWEQRAKRLVYEEQEETFKDECLAAGQDPARMKVLDVQADVAEKLDIRRAKKKNPDSGFADFEQASFRKYQRLTKAMKPDLKAYEDEKAELGVLMFPDADTLGLTQRKDKKSAIDRMAADVEEQSKKRKEYSRRRAFDEEADVDYINDKNMRYNKKLERFYGQYTAEIKQNLERGTAV